MRQQSTSNSFATLTSRFGAMTALLLSFVLTACGGSGERPIIETEPGLDGIAPSLNEATVLNKCNMTPVVALDDTITITIDSDESILKPVVTIAGNEVAMSGQHHSWSGEYVLEDAGDLENGDIIPLNISYADNSGMNGNDISEADDGALTFCDAEVTTCQCFPEDISGVWQNANKINAMGVGPYEGDTSYWNVDDFELGRRDCVFDDTYTFTADETTMAGGGIFSQEMDGWTWLESWASPDGLESCGVPVAPWDGLQTGLSYKWDPEQGELTVFGEGAHIGIPRIINNGDASTSGAASSIVYNIATASNCFISMNILAGGDLWWHFELERIAMADGTPVTSESDYCSAAAAPVGDGSSSDDADSDNTGSDNTDSDNTGSDNTDSDNTDSDNSGSDNTGSTDNDNNLLSGNWTLAPSAGSLGVGPSQGNISWWSADEAEVGTRACLYDDIFSFNSDGSFANVMGADTWLEGWQGAEGCGVAVAPFDGSNAATYSYDASAGTLTVSGLGAHIGLPKVTNDGEIDDVADAASSVTYTVSAISDTAMTLDIDFGGGWWRFELVCADDSCTGSAGESGSDDSASDDTGSDDSGSDDTGSDNVAPTDNDNELLSGDWMLSPTAGSLGVGPSQGNISWWSTDEAEVGTRACLYDDIVSFNADGSFANVMGADTWLEGWQGAEGCGAPVAPFDGSNAATYSYDAAAATLTVYGLGAHIGLPKVNNDGEIDDVANAVSSITYTVTSISDTAMTLDIAFGTTGWWRYELVCADDSCTGSAGESGSDDTGSDDTGSDDTGSGDAGSDDTGSDNPNAAAFTGTFDGTTVEGNTFNYPSDAADWAGFANENQALYPLSFPEESVINFTASSDEPVTLKFRFEYNPWPDVDPNFETDTVVVDGACQAYSVVIPAQPEANTYSSYLMYIIENDIPVTVNDVVIGGDVPACPSADDSADEPAPEPEPEPTDPPLTEITVPELEAATQHVYFSETALSEDGTQLVIKLSYLVDDPTLTGMGLVLNFDSDVLVYDSVSDVLPGTVGAPSVNPDHGGLVLAWSDPFGGSWPGSTEAELATITFNIVEGSTGSTVISMRESSIPPGYAFDGQSLQIDVVGSDDTAGSTDDTAGSTDDTAGSTDDTAGSTDDTAGSTDDTAGSTDDTAGSADDTSDASDLEESPLSVPELLDNTQHVYVSEKTISTDGTQAQVTVKLSYLVDDPTLTGIGFKLIFDSDVLEFDSVSNVRAGSVGSPSLNPDGDLVLAWSDPFGGSWPGSTEAELATVIFNVAEGSTGITTLDFEETSTPPGYNFDGQSHNMLISQ